MENARACGRSDCTDCPRQRVGRCHATPQQREDHACTCGLSRVAREENEAPQS